MQGLLYLLSPVTFTLLTRYPRLQYYCAPAGLVITVIGSLLSSFSTQVWHLIATQGVICAIGNGLLFSPSSLYLDQWFLRRKGLALGTMWAAKSITGVALPFIASASLHKFGSSTTLRAWTVITVCFSLSFRPLVLYEPVQTCASFSFSFCLDHQHLKLMLTRIRTIIIVAYHSYGLAIHETSYPGIAIGFTPSLGSELPQTSHILDAAGGEYHPELWIFPTNNIPPFLFNNDYRTIPEHWHDAGVIVQRNIYFWWDRPRSPMRPFLRHKHHATVISWLGIISASILGHGFIPRL